MPDQTVGKIEFPSRPPILPEERLLEPSRIRSRVFEWRLSVSLLGLRVRLWIESDPVYGGIPSFEEAEKAVSKAIITVKQMQPQEWYGKQKVCEVLLDLLPSANSIEVCDSGGNGGVIHKDWP